MPALLKIRLLVSGRVQGVFYRQSTQDMARSLGLVGWVRNLAGGQVEIEAFGSAEAVDRLSSWCEIGPSQAKVVGVQVQLRQTVEQSPFSDFQILN